MKLRLLVTGLVCSLVLASAQAKVINHDPGGLLKTYILDAKEAYIKREPIQILGLCASACTTYLSNPKVCVGPNAVLMFHSVFNAPPKDVEVLNTWLMSIYPAPVRDWIITKGGLTQDILVLQGPELQGMLPACN